MSHSHDWWVSLFGSARHLTEWNVLLFASASGFIAETRNPAVFYGRSAALSESISWHSMHFPPVGLGTDSGLVGKAKLQSQTMYAGCLEERSTSDTS
eukprot:173938-Amphidinium_carterae.1